MLMFKGFGASRVTSEETCYVRLLSKTLEEQVAYLQEHENKPMSVEGEAQVDAIPVDDAYEELGDEIAKFCDDFPAYKLVKKQDVDESEEREQRQVAVTFRRCVIICFRYSHPTAPARLLHTLTKVSDVDWLADALKKQTDDDFEDSFGKKLHYKMFFIR